MSAQLTRENEHGFEVFNQLKFLAIPRT